MPFFERSLLSFALRHTVRCLLRLADAPGQRAAVQAALADRTQAMRLQEILEESLRLIRTTTRPRTFFGRYDDALSCAEQIIEVAPTRELKAYGERVRSDLLQHRSEKTRCFLDRCYEKGVLYSIRDELFSGQYEIPADAESYAGDLLQKLEADCSPPPGGVYIYCSVSFTPGGKTYYYKTTDSTLACGDRVLVPVGSSGRSELATVEEIEHFPAGQTPYPPGLTKDILEKYAP